LFDIKSNISFYSLNQTNHHHPSFLSCLPPTTTTTPTTRAVLSTTATLFPPPVPAPATNVIFLMTKFDLRLLPPESKPPTSTRQGKIGHQAGYIPRALRRSATMPARISTPAASGSKSSSNRASNGSKDMRVQPRNSDHIRRGPVIQLPKADKPGKAPTGGIAHKNSCAGTIHQI
jgi:hypothetical protein